MSKPDKAGQTCNKCFEHKPLTDYYRDRKQVRKRQHTCKVCWSAISAKRNNIHRAHMLARNPTTQVPCIICGKVLTIGIGDYNASRKFEYNLVCRVHKEADVTTDDQT